MRILHIAPLAPYNVGWGYQENLLPKYQKKLGYEVSLIVSPFENTENGKVDVGENDFVLPDGIKVYRRRRLFGNGIVGKAISFTNIKDILYEFKPDLVMVHSLLTLSIFQVIKYKKTENNNLVIIQDNHLDENIGKKKTKLFTDIVYKYWAIINSFASKYVDRYYGVTPWRRDFIINRFGIKKEKTDVLIMGADMENIDFLQKNQVRDKVLNELSIDKNKFVICTGGKIEQNKCTHLLMEAVSTLNNVELIVFGTVADDYKKIIDEHLNGNVHMVGWKNSDEINEIYLSSDLAFFPGQHSVLWEQACACKLPCVFSYWDGMSHLDVGGNSKFISEVSVEEIRKCIETLFFTDEYKRMLEVAESKLTDVFSYEEIAKKSVEMCLQI